MSRPLALFSWVFLLFLASASAVAAVPAVGDWDVTYLERTPRYFRYDVAYTYGGGPPYLKAANVGKQRWPVVGEMLTYTAHVRNRGGAALTGFDWVWKADGTVFASGSLTSTVAVGAEVLVTVLRAFPASPERLAFELSPAAAQAQITANNDSRDMGSHEWNFAFWVEQGMVDAFNQRLNPWGSYSFEDWLQKQYGEMNRVLATSTYPSAPTGSINRVRIDRIVILPQLDMGYGPGNPMYDDPLIDQHDGRWQLTDTDPTNNLGNNPTASYPQGFYAAYADGRMNPVWPFDNAMVHESGHQLGLVDLYAMNLPSWPAQNCGVQVQDLGGNPIPYTNLPPGNSESPFMHGGVMGGGEIAPHQFEATQSGFFSSHDIGALNSAPYERRGFYGDYLYDVPAQVVLEVVDPAGAPLGGVQVDLFQKHFNSHWIDNTPEITGSTGPDGRLSLDNRTVGAGTTTADGHTLHDNPFGIINVVASNATSILRLRACGAEDFRYFMLCDLNLAFWQGETGSYVHRIVWEGCSSQPAVVPTAPAVLRLNCAGPDFTDSQGQLWMADRPYNAADGFGRVAGSTGSIPVGVANTVDDALYQTMVLGTIEYKVDLPPGDYRVTLHFAEPTFASPVERLFTVWIEEARRWTNVDLPAVAGIWTAYQLSGTRTVTDGSLNLRLTSNQNGAVLSAIEILRSPFTPTPTPTPSATPTATPSASPTPTATPTATPSASPTPTATLTATASATPTPTPTSSASPTSTATPTATASATPTPSPSATRTITPSATAVFSPSPTATPTEALVEFGDAPLVLESVPVPNPWAGRGKLQVRLAGPARSLRVKVYTQAMNLVASSRRGAVAAGWNTLAWPDELARAGAGVYFFRVSAEGLDGKMEQGAPGRLCLLR